MTLENQNLWSAEEVQSNPFITIDITRMRMSDYVLFEEYKGVLPTKLQCKLLAKVSQFSEEEILDLDIEQYAAANRALNDAMENILKKVNAGS
jgi:hypothetical protein